jgi:hypothetical protein
MTVKQEIEQQEQEFKQLLGRVMRDPLAPVHDSVTKLDARLEELEAMLQDIRDVGLSGLGLHVEEMSTQVRQLKSKTGETPREVRLAVEPILQRLQVQVEQTQLATHNLLKDESKRVDGAVHRLDAQLAGVADSVSESRKTLQSALQVNVDQIEGTLHAASSRAQAEMRHLATDLGVQVTRQVESNEQAFERLQDLFKQAVAHLRETSANERKQVEERIDALTTSQSEVRTMFAEQNHQLDTLKQQQDAISGRMAEQLRHATQRMGMWLLASAGLVCLGYVSAAVFIMQKL